MLEQTTFLVHLGDEKYVICEVNSRFPTVLQAITKTIDGAVPANMTYRDYVQKEGIRDKLNPLTRYLLL